MAFFFGFLFGAICGVIGLAGLITCIDAKQKDKGNAGILTEDFCDKMNGD
jgi:hypothetical protein